MSSEISMEMKAEQPLERYRKMRRFEVRGITLEQALLFENEEWCDKFFSSFRKMNDKYHQKMLYLRWKVENSLLSKDTFSWELICAGQTGHEEHGQVRVARNQFNSNEKFQKVSKRTDRHPYEPRMHGHHKTDLVMISPGEGHDVGLGGRDIGVGRGRCANVTNYMCCPQESWEGPLATSRDEMKALWQLVGRVALARLGRRPSGFFWDGRTDGEKKDRTFPLGHEEVEINTHGGGLPWLHVRVEAEAEYNTYTGATRK